MKVYSSGFALSLEWVGVTGTLSCIWLSNTFNQLSPFHAIPLPSTLLLNCLYEHLVLPYVQAQSNSNHGYVFDHNFQLVSFKTNLTSIGEQTMRDSA
jgi:hypothetical protein